MKAWERKGRGIRLFLLAPFVLVMLLPLVMTVSGSFLGAEEAGENLQVVFSGSAGGKEYASWPIFPRYPTLQSYIRLLLDTPEFFHMFWNSMIEVLPVLFALFMTGILTKRTLITVVTAIYSIFYFILFVSMKEVPYGTWGGVGTRISASRMCIQCLMSLGMIALGIYLWRRREGGLKETDRG